jgi:LytS/YehU family sensor histidine kinase
LQHASDYYSRFRENELKASSLEAELARAQMQALKMQLHPHFLFNTLNAIVTLVHKDPDTAEQMIVRLSDFLRLTLKSSGKQMITLKEELEFVKAYLDIEHTRFNDRLAVNISLDESLQDAEVPNLLLQPLIENAIKHGITPNTSGGIISIAANKTDGLLKISIRDNGSKKNGNSETKLKEGVGLSNTRARLNKLFGSKASLNLKYNEPCGVEVTVSLPFRIAEQS